MYAACFRPVGARTKCAVRQDLRARVHGTSTPLGGTPWYALDEPGAATRPGSPRRPCVNRATEGRKPAQERVSGKNRARVPGQWRGGSAATPRYGLSAVHNVKRVRTRQLAGLRSSSIPPRRGRVCCWARTAPENHVFLNRITGLIKSRIAAHRNRWPHSPAFRCISAPDWDRLSAAGKLRSSAAHVEA